MPFTFEERVSEELDALYAGAVFLCGGEGPRARDLVVDAVRLASREYSDQRRPDSFTQWMEGMLVRPLLQADVTEADGRRVVPLETSHADAVLDFRWSDVVDAAAGMPTSARVAIWLVVLRRWSYEQTQAVMGIGREALRQLLGFRSQLSRAAAADGDDGEAQGTGS